VVNGHLFILIRQMAALIRRAVAEVCTVPVLLVLFLLQSAHLSRVTSVFFPKGKLLRFVEQVLYRTDMLPTAEDTASKYERKASIAN